MALNPESASFDLNIICESIKCIQPQKMSPNVNSKKTKSTNGNKNCRLRHGLNFDCLAHIFQYLDSRDLNTLGAMSHTYKCIIRDLVIPKHEIRLSGLSERQTILKIFRRYGSKMQKLYFNDSNNAFNVKDLAKSIQQFCPTDQLKCVQIYCRVNRVDNKIVHLPSHFQKVTKFVFHGANRRLLSIDLSECLCHLDLAEIDLKPKFNWTKFQNLKELHLKLVFGINVKKFIEFLQQKPNLEVFHHDQFAFGNATQKVCEAVAKYCGNYIRDYAGEMCPAQNTHNFISGFKSLKKVCLTTYHACAGDLVDAMKRLAENDTIEMLHIKYSPISIQETRNCMYKGRSNRDGFDMGHFSHLKTVKIGGFVEFETIRELLRINVCSEFNLFGAYSAQILSNVEHLAAPCSWNFFVCTPKLRHLTLYAHSGYSNREDEIALILLGILVMRNDGYNNDDIIYVQFDK